MSYVMQAGIFRFNLTGKKCKIPRGQRKKKKKKVGVRKWAFPPDGEKENMTRRNEIYKI